MYDNTSKRFVNQSGASLVTVLMTLVVLSVLGMGLATVSFANIKLTTVERDFQSAYYIAEAGANQAYAEIKSLVEQAYETKNTQEQFYHTLSEWISNEIDGVRYVNFESSFGENPEANISVSSDSLSDSERKYTIRSKGIIGDRTRTVETELLIEWLEQGSSQPAAFVYGERFKFAGNTVNGSDATIIVQDALQTGDFNGGSFTGVSNVYINGSLSLTSGGAAIGSITHPGKIYINGDLNLSGGVALHGDVYVAGDLNITNGSIENGNVYVQGDGNLDNGEILGDVYIAGNTRIVNAQLNGKVYSGGHLTYGWTPKGSFSVDYIGSLTYPSNFDTTILSRANKVSSIPTIPTFEIPEYNISLKSDDWYKDRDYTLQTGNVSMSVIPDNLKLVTEGNFNSHHHTSPSGDVVIISKHGDIDISGWRNLTGVLIAPEGEVRFGGASFTGVVLTKHGFDFHQGGSTLNAKDISYFFNEADIPVDITGSNVTDSGRVSVDDLIRKSGSVETNSSMIIE